MAKGELLDRFNFRHGTKYYDPETGLYYYGFRYYDPNTGRWINRDPKDEPGFQQTTGIKTQSTKYEPEYVFVQNNPVMYWDWMGLLEHYTLILNGAKFTKLTGTGFSADVHSGNGKYRNDASFTHIKSDGPIPKGTYYIVDRIPGGMLGALRDWFSGKDIWFSLYSDDGKIDDNTEVTYVDASGKVQTVIRGQFRAHSGTLSLGCVTFKSMTEYNSFRKTLLGTKTDIIPKTTIKYYGTITVK